MIGKAETRVKSKSRSNTLQYLSASVGSSPQKTVYTLSKIICSLVRYQTANSSLTALAVIKRYQTLVRCNSALDTDVNEPVYDGDRLLELESSSAMEIQARSCTLDFKESGMQIVGDVEVRVLQSSPRERF
jgi:hypothetical protein